MIKAVIFDMDGLLINSEPFWRKAETEVFNSLGIKVTEEDCSETMGLRIDFAVRYWFNKFNYSGMTIEETSEKVVQRVKDLIYEQGCLMPGVLDTLKIFKDIGLPMAIASSSSMDLINAVVKKCDIKEYFNSLVSAEKEKYGKPHPAVFLSAAESLKKEPMECIVFEDSLSGVIAAKAALMKVIAVPSEIVKNEKGFVIADMILNSLKDSAQVVKNYIIFD